MTLRFPGRPAGSDRPPPALCESRPAAGRRRSRRPPGRWSPRRPPGGRRGLQRPGGRRDLLRPAAGRDSHSAGGGRSEPAGRPGKRSVMIWSWIPQNAGQIWQLTVENAYLGLAPALLGLIVSVRLGIICVRWGWLYPPVLSGTSIIYAIPSLALFVALIPYTGISDTTVIIPLTLS